MDDTQRDALVMDDNAVDRLVEKAHDEQSSAGPVNRMLANPRRIRL